MQAQSIPAAALAAVALALAAPAAAPVHAAAPARAQDPEAALSTLIDRNLRSGGSWFTPSERAVVERKCGYSPGEWDGFEASLSDGTFTCRNGRVVRDDPEMSAVLRTAEPRIRARVSAVMKRADVAAAIARVARAAAAEALAGMEARRRGR